MTPKKITTSKIAASKIAASKTTPRKILISLAGLFGCGLVSLLAAVAAPNTAVGQLDHVPVQFYNGGQSEDVEFAVEPQNCDREPPYRREGVHRVRARQTITLHLADFCDWTFTMVGCNAYVQYKSFAQRSDYLPRGAENHVETSGRFTFTQGRPLRWNGETVQHVTMTRRDSTSDLGCNSYFSPFADIMAPAGAEASNQHGESVFAGTTIPVTFTGSQDQCWVVVDRVPSLDNIVDFTVGADGRVTPVQISLIDTVYRAQEISNQAGNSQQHRCSYALSFPESVGGMALQAGTATPRITGGSTAFEAQYGIGAETASSAQPALALAAASDTGYRDSDSITSNAAPTIAASGLVADAWVVVQGQHTRDDGSYLTIEQTFQATGDSADVTFGNNSRSDQCRVTERSADHSVSRDAAASGSCGLNQTAGQNNGTWTFTATQYEPGKLGTAADPLDLTLHQAAPRITAMYASATSVGAGFSVPLTFNFSEPVYEFTAADLTVTGATVAEPVSQATDGGPASTYNATLTANADAERIRVDLPRNKVRNVAGVLNFVNGFALTLGVHAQSAKPTAALRAGQDTGASDSDLLLAGNMPIITAGNLVPGATVSVKAEHLLANGSIAEYERVFTATGTTGDASFGNENLGGSCTKRTVDPSGSWSPGGRRDTCPLTEAAGSNSTLWRVTVTQTEPDKEPSSADVLEFVLDDVSPRLASFTADPATVAAGATAQLTLEFSEAVTGLAAADLTVTGGTVSALAADAADDTRYSATLTAGQGVAEATVTIHENAATDLAGNALDVGGNGSVVVTVAPAEEPEPADPEPAALLPTPVVSLNQAFGGDSNFTRNDAPLFDLDNLQVGAEVVATLRYDMPGSAAGDFTRFSKTFIATDSSMSIDFINPAMGGECSILTSAYGWVVAVEGQSQDCIMLPGEQGAWTFRALQRNPDGSGEAQSAPLVITYSLDDPAPEPPAEPAPGS